MLVTDQNSSTSKICHQKLSVEIIQAEKDSFQAETESLQAEKKAIEVI